MLDSHPEQGNQGYSKIGGWLILFGIGLVIFFLVASIIFVSTDYLIINLFLIRGNSLNVDSTINFVGTAVAGAIWIPYFMFSRRVKQTFTR